MMTADFVQEHAVFFCGVGLIPRRLGFDQLLLLASCPQSTAAYWHTAVSREFERSRE
jgi:hypothetical protein